MNPNHRDEYDFIKGLNICFFQSKKGLAAKINIRFDLLYEMFVKHSQDGKNLNVLALPRPRIGDGTTTHYVVVDKTPKRIKDQFHTRGHHTVGLIDSNRKDPDVWDEDDKYYKKPNF